MNEAVSHRRVSDEGLPERWKRALEYYRSRGAVIFLSQGRFWEKHSFPQQSLAKYLTREGIRVIWLDSYGWLPYQPTLYFRSPHLTVKQLFQPPGCRFSPARKAIRAVQGTYLRRLIRKIGDNPIVWVQDAYQEDLVDQLPHVDVYSVFDNPYLHDPRSGLCERAKLIVCQNSHATRIFQAHQLAKTHLMLPPMDMDDGVFTQELGLSFPAGFPERIMGVVGSVMSHDFDWHLLEGFIRRFPDWGFLVLGRTDSVGANSVRQLGALSNFHYLPWVPRSHVKSAWKALSVCLLLYRPHPPQDGAFPTRALEAFRFGVPCVATRIPKTEDLEGIVTRSNDACTLMEAALNVASEKSGGTLAAYEALRERMDPISHLTQVAEFLRGNIS